MYVVYINLLYFCRFFCLLTIKIFFPKKIDDQHHKSDHVQLYYVPEQAVSKLVS